MMIFSVRQIIVQVFCTIIFTTCTMSQVVYKDIYDAKIQYSKNSSSEVIKRMARGKNAYNYINIGYFLNANNIMFKKTGDKLYLDYNMEILDIILNQDRAGDSDEGWKIQVASSNQNASSNNKESVNFEGYFFRYLGEFLHIIKSERLYNARQQSIELYLTKSFNKWRKLSEKSFKDMSTLYHQRIHIAANWAVVSLYLYELTKEEIYKEFYGAFDKQLRKNLVIKKKNGKACYVWNSTYSEKFTVALRKRETSTPIIQDVSHGNHVINYVVTAHKFHPDIWTEDDLKIFSNTLIELIWDDHSKTFSDNVDGTDSKNKEVRNTGWKQADGWMKLMTYSPQLVNLYRHYYTKNSSKISRTSFELQYLANLK